MVNVNDIIRESYKLREYNLKVSNIELRLSLAGDLPPTYADPYQLQQVFTNIINNACDALRDKNGGTLTTRSAGKRDILRIEFEDDGPGIAKKNIKKIFDPFFTTKEVGKGTGLGLSMSYGIIEEHGGKIDVESEQGKGTKFTVSIPVVSGRHEEVETAADKSTGHAGKRVLVVDDEGSIREMLSIALSMEGYIVETSSSGQEALPLIEAESFDAIIMDMKMPGMEGRQLYAHILNSYPEKAKKYSSLPEIPWARTHKPSSRLPAASASLNHLRSKPYTGCSMSFWSNSTHGRSVVFCTDFRPVTKSPA